MRHRRLWRSCGTCAAGTVCGATDQCECVPNCEGKQCGADDCGGTCGTCAAGTVCGATDQCECVPNCEGKQCGADGCGGSCGTCGAGTVCGATDQCECVPSCDGKQCGPDGCGGSCGTCDLANASSACDSGSCAVVDCAGGFDDCDKDPSNGCEASLDAVTSCGACAVVCDPTEVCGAGTCFEPSIAVSTGDSTGCALTSDGRVHCWGWGEYGQLGDGSKPIFGVVPVQVSGLEDAVGVAVGGGGFACAVRSTGAVACWGRNLGGALGDGSETDSPTPVAVLELTDAVAVAAGYGFACALRETGQVACWGGGASLVTVSGIADATHLALGQQYACAVRATGHVSCWGSNFYGQLGDGTKNDSPVPVSVSEITDAVEVAAGSGHTCVRRSTGGVACWGWGVFGQLGDGSTNQSLTPVTVVGLSDAVGISAGAIAACAVRSTGQLWCWGDNYYGQLGSGDPEEVTPTPVLARLWGGGALSDAVSADAGDTTCLVRSDGSIWCAGEGDALGDGQQSANAGYRARFYPVRGLAPIAFEEGMCGDGLDNDGDGLVDCEDPDCAVAVASVLGLGAIVGELGNLSPGNYETLCEPTIGGREQRFLWTAPSAGTWRFDTVGSAINTVLRIDAGDCSGLMMSCNDDGPALGVDAQVDVVLGEGETVAIRIESIVNWDNGAFQINIQPAPPRRAPPASPSQDHQFSFSRQDLPSQTGPEGHLPGGSPRGV
ncbi:MAG: hypothetical protein R3F39_14410 [Myxococcota bacterium]